MPNIDFFYGDSFLSLDLPASRLRGILRSRAHDYTPDGAETEIVRKALTAPIASERLRALAKGKKDIVLLACDHTRPVPSRILFPLMAEEITAGNPDARITILVATGCHRETTRAELKDKFGKDVCNAYPIVVHNCDTSPVVPLGKLPSGGELLVNKMAAEADLLIAEGFIEPHFFAGFSGGRKSLFPGVTNRRSVLANHCSAFIANPRARAGILEGNPIHRDMVFAAGAAKLAFIVNVAIDSEKKIIACFAGHYDKAHLAGASFVSRLSAVAAKPADIVITTNGGYPLDQNLYQAVKGMTAAESACKKGGVIIIAARCEDGHGGENFYATFKNEKNPARILKTFIDTPMADTRPDQWQSQIFARVLLSHTVIMVTQADRDMVEDMHMRFAPTLEEALRMADAILGHSAGSIAAIPDGIGVIVCRDASQLIRSSESQP